MARVPKRDRSDWVHALAKSGLTAVPVVGGPAAILFEELLPASVTKRRLEFVQHLADRVDELVERVERITPEALAADERFVSSLLQAAEIATRTHKVEKLEALLNAVQNVATAEIEDDLAHVFLSWVDTLAPSHLSVLAVFLRPNFASTNRASAVAALDRAVPALQASAFRDLILEDLVSRGLVHSGLEVSYGVVAGGPAWPSGSLLTELGEQFLQFVSAPDWRRDD